MSKIGITVTIYISKHDLRFLQYFNYLLTYTVVDNKYMRYNKFNTFMSENHDCFVHDEKRKHL